MQLTVYIIIIFVGYLEIYLYATLQAIIYIYISGHCDTSAKVINTFMLCIYACKHAHFHETFNLVTATGPYLAFAAVI